MSKESFDAYFLDFDFIDVNEKEADLHVSTSAAVIVITDAIDVTPESKELLLNILSAIGISDESQCQIITLAVGEMVPFRKLKTASAAKFLIMGLAPSRISLQIEARANQQIHFGGKSLVFGPTLATLLKNRDAKKALWDAIKTWKS